MTVEESQKKVKQLFEALVNQYGDSYKSLAYGSKESQMQKFRILSEIADLNGVSICDVGCGFADFYQYLVDKGIKVGYYYGFDIVPKIIETAKKKHPQLELEVADITKIEPIQKFDYVIGTGFNCFKTGFNEEALKIAIRKMFDMCKRGAAIQMISKYGPRDDGLSYYASPEEVFSHCMRITKRVVLRHDYRENDFTIYMYR